MKITIIGCGVMGSALARHFSQHHSLILCDRHAERAQNLAQELNSQVADSNSAIEQADVVLLAIKPKDLSAFAQKTAEHFTNRHLLISILAATSLANLRQLFPRPQLLRALPNLPIICGKGIVGLSTATQENAFDQKQIEALFQGVGLLQWLPESQLEALSALVGSGPAFVFVLIEAMVDSGIFLGLKPQDALALILQLLEGSVALLKATQKHPGELKWQVASPGGTTIAGLKSLEESGIRGILMKAFEAIYLKKPL